MAVLLHDRPEAAGQKQREALRLPRTSAVVALFAFSSRMDRDSMRLFARTHGDEVRAAAIASTGQEVLELLHGGLRPQVLVLDALLTKPSVTQVLQEISTMQPDPEPAVLVLVPVPEETAARKALGLFAQYRIMLRPYGMKNLFDEIYRMGTTDDEHRLYHLRRCCEDVLDDFGARSTLNGYRYAERMLLHALYAERPQKIGDLQQYQRAEIFSGFEEIIPPCLRPVGFVVSRIRLQDFLHLQRLLLRTVSGIRKQTCRKRRHTVLFFQAVI